jgi:hypothetical protein
LRLSNLNASLFDCPFCGLRHAIVCPKITSITFKEGHLDDPIILRIELDKPTIIRDPVRPKD